MSYRLQKAFPPCKMEVGPACRDAEKELNGLNFTFIEALLCLRAYYQSGHRQKTGSGAFQGVVSTTFMSPNITSQNPISFPPIWVSLRLTYTVMFFLVVSL